SATTSSCACHTCTNAQNSSKNSHGTGTAKLLAKPMLMTAGKVGCFVGNNTDDFIWRFRLHQSTRIDENATTINERIEAGRVDQNDPYTARTQASCFQDRRCII